MMIIQTCGPTPQATVCIRVRYAGPPTSNKSTLFYMGNGWSSHFALKHYRPARLSRSETYYTTRAPKQYTIRCGK